MQYGAYRNPARGTLDLETVRRVQPANLTRMRGALNVLRIQFDDLSAAPGDPGNG